MQQRAAPTTSAPARAVPTRVVAAIVATILAWASAFVVIRGVATSYPPGALALGRLVVATLVLGVVLLARRSWTRMSGRNWMLMLGCGVLWFAAYNLALNAAEQRLDAGTAAMLVNVGPVLMMLLAGAFLGEGFPRWLLIGSAVSLAGAVLIGLATGRTADADLAGVALALTAALVYATGVILQKPVLRRVSALQVTLVGCAVGMITCLPFLGDLIDAVRTAPASHTVGAFYLGLVPTALAFLTWAYALSHLPAGQLGVSTYLVPPITVLLSWGFLGEVPPALAVAGGTLCLIGVALTRRRTARREEV